MFEITKQPLFTKYLLVGILTESETFSLAFSYSTNMTVLCAYRCVHHYTSRLADSIKCELPCVTNHACTAMSDTGSGSCSQLYIFLLLVTSHSKVGGVYDFE